MKKILLTLSFLCLSSISGYSLAYSQAVERKIQGIEKDIQKIEERIDKQEEKQSKKNIRSTSIDNKIQKYKDKIEDKNEEIRKIKEKEDKNIEKKVKVVENKKKQINNKILSLEKSKTKKMEIHRKKFENDIAKKAKEDPNYKPEPYKAPDFPETTNIEKLKEQLKKLDLDIQHIKDPSSKKKSIKNTR